MTETLGLFDQPLPTPVARASDPATSHAAAESMAGATRSQYLAILQHLANVRGDGATANEIDITLDWRDGTAGRRLAELATRLGWVRVLEGTRPTASGRAAQIYVLTLAGADMLDRPPLSSARPFRHIPAGVPHDGTSCHSRDGCASQPLSPRDIRRTDRRPGRALPRAQARGPMTARQNPMKKPTRGVGRNPTLTPGNPGNRGGRKGRSGRKPAVYRDLCRDLIASVAAVRSVQRILQNDEHPHFATMYRHLADHAHGKPVQPVTGEDGGAIVVRVIREEPTGARD